MSSYVLKIEGKNIDTFLLLLTRLKISFIVKKKTRNILIIEVLEEDYKKISKIKTTYHITIIKRKGLCNFLHFFKTRKLFLLVSFLGFIFFNILTNITFSIKVIDSDQDFCNLIIEDLAKYGIKKYNFKVNYLEKEKIKKQILKKEKDLIEWLEIEEKGISYEIKVIKRIKKNQKKINTPQDIIAKKKGVITKIVAESGEVLTKKNDTVNKGDVLISGLIKNKDNIVSKVRAEGKVYAEIWYLVKLELPKTYHEQIKTGKNKKVLSISFLNKDYDFFDFKPYTNSKDSKKTIYKNIIFPFSINLKTKEEIKTKDINFKENLSKEVFPLAKSKLKIKIGNDIKILDEKILKKEENPVKIKVDVFFKVEEDITDYRSLKNIDIAKENEKIKQESNG